MAKRRTDTSRDAWREQLTEVMRPIHKHMTARAVEKLLVRLTRAISIMRSRSRKHNVAFTLTLDELRTLVASSYGTPCRYCERTITLSVFVFDHLIPISKGGATEIANIQIICKTCNGMKGALSEENFLMLLAWLDQMPVELSTELRRRLCGVHV
jgi:5-methylcytosine-specific restriction endonuclease McrA